MPTVVKLTFLKQMFRAWFPGAYSSISWLSSLNLKLYPNLQQSKFASVLRLKTAMIIWIFPPIFQAFLNPIWSKLLHRWTAQLNSYMQHTLSQLLKSKIIEEVKILVKKSLCWGLITSIHNKHSDHNEVFHTIVSWWRSLNETQMKRSTIKCQKG